MGAIELQIFVSLVVVLGAAFVALICDFLKGNNEQLRESNIEMRVRQHEREKRDAILDQVQRHTIETLAQARVALVPPAVPTPRTVAVQQTSPTPAQQVASEEQDTSESFERTQQERSARRREGRRQQPPPVTVDRPVDAVLEAVLPMQAESAIAAPTRAGVELRQMETQEPLPMPLAAHTARSIQQVTAGITPSGEARLPQSDLAVELPVYDVVEAAAAAPAQQLAEDNPLEEQLPEMDSPVVRIRVLSEHDVVQKGEPIELALPISDTDSIHYLEPQEPALLGVPIEPIMAEQNLEPALPVAAIEPILAVEPLELAQTAVEPVVEPLVEMESALPESSHIEIRSNVVEMPVAPVARNSEFEQPAPAELVIPGGFHEASSLARLLEDEEPFNGLAIVISVVDYVRLMADQGKPAVEQLMGSVSRLVISLAREEDFACRIAEDEFVLLFARETGPAAKRRIQLVSERLWDFQLRSLGSVSVIFSWGASESTREAVVHAVEHAREQMLESRRNRRALASSVGRFRRRAANS